LLTAGQEPGRHGLRAIIDDWALAEALMKRAKRNQASLNDLLLAVATRFMRRWNHERAAATDYFRLLLATSLKGRTPLPEHTGTGLSALTMMARGRAADDLDAGIAYFRDYRRSALEQRLDVKAWAWMSQWYSLLRVLPLSVRMRHLAPQLTRTQIGFNLSNVGVVWPKIVDGRATYDSVILGAGELVIEDLHSCPTFGPHTDLGLVTRMHNRRLYFNFVCDRFRFREPEARELVADFMAELIAAA
jgi:hypothetical protein